MNRSSRVVFGFSTVLLVLLLLATLGQGREDPTVDPELRKQAMPWIEKLDSSSFAEREEAMEKLMEMGRDIRPLLLAVEGNGSVEARTRVRKVLLFLEELDRIEKMGIPSEADWPMLKRGQTRSASDGRGAVGSEPELQWVTDLPAVLGEPKFDCPLLVLGDRLIVTNRFGGVASVDRKTGELLWYEETGQRILAGPVAVSGLIYLPGRSLIALEAATGRVRWKWDTGYGVTSTPLVHGGHVFATEAGERIVALDAATGEEIWDERLPSTRSSPVILGERIVVGSEDGVFAFDAETGRRRWRFRTRDPVDSAAAMLPDRLVIGDTGRNVYAIDIQYGRQIWQRCLPDGAVVTSPVIYGDAVLFGTDGASFRALRASDGADLWTRYVGSVDVSSPAVAGGVAYFTGGPRIRALSCANGDDIFRIDLGRRFASPVLAEGTLYVVTDDGVLLAYK